MAKKTAASVGEKAEASVAKKPGTVKKPAADVAPGTERTGVASDMKPGAEIRDGAVYLTQAGTRVYVKTADLCEMTGKTNQWIGQLVSQGVLSRIRTRHGNQFEMHDAVRAYLGMLDARQAAETETEEQLKKEQLAADVKMKRSKALIADMDAKERQGQMHRSEDVAAMTADLIYAIRGALLALPGRLAVDVLSAGTPAEASEIIRGEVYRVMEELTGYEYDPAKYEERMRERLRLAAAGGEDE